MREQSGKKGKRGEGGSAEKRRISLGREERYENPSE
jgi:hypothetical protein